MGNSTITLQDVVDGLASLSDINPSANPGSYALDTLLSISNRVLTGLIARRFNWKWNSNLAPAFYTNGYQQDYPMAGLNDIGWLESAWWVDINSTTRPIPLEPFETMRDIEIDGGRYTGQPEQLCWMYNKQLQRGMWPGSAVALGNPRTNGPIPQNPVLSFLDANGNILTLTSYGTTGTTAPAAPAASLDATPVPDGSCIWTVCAPGSQGFRLVPLPPSGGPVYELHVKYQAKPVRFVSMQDTLGVIPDEYAPYFVDGFKVMSYSYATDENVRKQYPAMLGEWMQQMTDAEKQGDREPDSFRLLPATSVVEGTYGFRDPNNPRTPY